MMSSSISYWQKREESKNLPLCIIGSGIVGMTTAYFIKEKMPNQEIWIIDKESVCGGASIRNAGFTCFGSPTELLDDIDRVGESQMIETVKLRWAGLNKLHTLINNDHVDYNQYGAYELYKKDKELEYVREELPRINALLSEVFNDDNVFSIQDATDGIVSSCAGVFNRYEGQLDPYKMVMSIRSQLVHKGVQFINNTNVTHIDFENKVIHSDAGPSVQASDIVLCTNAYTQELLNVDDCSPVRNQVYVTEPIRGLKFKGNIHIDKGYVYIRSIEDRLLIGGARNMFGDTESTSTFGNTIEVQEHLKGVLAQVYPESSEYKFEHQWSGILGVGNAKNAIIKKHENGAYLGVRLGGMGVAIGSEVGNQLANKILSDLTK